MVRLMSIRNAMLLLCTYAFESQSAWLPDLNSSQQLPLQQVVSIISSDSRPNSTQSKLVGQEKIFAPSTSCSKNVLLGCPGVQLQPRSGYAPTSNGCGPENWDNNTLGTFFKNVLNRDWSKNCCDEHDICFGSCNTTYNQCNIDFRNCLMDNCQNDVNCAPFVPFYTTAVESNMGCGIFIGDQDATKNNCQCPPTSANQQYKENFRQFYFTLDSYIATQLRSSTTDNITVIMGVDINDVPSEGGQIVLYTGPQGISVQNVTDVSLSFWAFDADVITPWISIYSGDLSMERLSTLKDRINEFSLSKGIGILGAVNNAFGDISKAVGGSLIGVFSSALGLANLTSTFDWLYQDCDGFVLTWTLTFNGSQVSTNSTFDYEQQGYMAASSCGTTSLYSAQFRFGLGPGESGFVTEAPSFVAPVPSTASALTLEKSSAILFTFSLALFLLL